MMRLIAVSFVVFALLAGRARSMESLIESPFSIVSSTTHVTLTVKRSVSHLLSTIPVIDRLLMEVPRGVGCIFLSL